MNAYPENSELFGNIPAVPAGCHDKVFRQYDQYLMYRNENGKRFCFCTSCKSFFEIGPVQNMRTYSDADVVLCEAEHLSSVVCPHCGERLIALNTRKYRCKAYNMGSTGAVYFLPVTQNEVWIRCFLYTRTLDYSKLRVTDEIWECTRYHLLKGEAHCFYRNGGSWEEVRFREPFLWNHGYWCEKYTYTFYEPSEMKLSDTFLKYAVNSDTAQNKFNSASCRWLCSYSLHPQVELLAKMGHSGVINDLVFRGVENVRTVDWNAKKPWQFYRLDKNVYDFFVKEYPFVGEIALDNLKLYHRINGKNIRDMKLAKTLYDRTSLYDYNRSLSKGYAVIKICKNLKIDVRDLLAYLDKCKRDNPPMCHCFPGLSDEEWLEKWNDYIEMARLAGKLDSINPLPKDLVAEHNKLLAVKKRAAAKKRREEAKAYAKRMQKDAVEQGKQLSEKFPKVEPILAKLKKRYEYNNGKLCVVVPEHISDIVYEGLYLNHCIHRTERYYDRIQRNESYLFFIRLFDKPDVPYYTIEVEPGAAVRQKRTFDDRQDADIKDIIAFISEWQNAITSKLTKREKALADKSRQLREENFRELEQTKTVVRSGHLRGKLLADVLKADLLDISLEQNEAKTNNNEKVG